MHRDSAVPGGNAAPRPLSAENPVDNLLDRLDRVRPSGPGRWSARCPGPLHQKGDRSPSLSIAIGDDGRALLKCFAGCSVDAITAALGMELSDLFPPRPIGRACPIPDHHRPRLSATEALAVIRREVAIVATAGEELLVGPLALPDMDILRTAVRRLNAVLTNGGFHHG